MTFFIFSDNIHNQSSSGLSKICFDRSLHHADNQPENRLKRSEEQMKEEPTPKIIFFGLIAMFASTGGHAGPILALIALIFGGCIHQPQLTTSSGCQKAIIIGLGINDEMSMVVDGDRQIVARSPDETMTRLRSRRTCVPIDGVATFHVRPMDVCMTRDTLMVLLLQTPSGTYQKAPLAFILRTDEKGSVCDVQILGTQ
ncbi:MAG: hypothetical protein WCT11_02795 [Candidatus Magasanikbacteria bacterium]